MTFTIIEIRGTVATAHTLDIETLEELSSLGFDRFGGLPMTIDWAKMTITIVID